MTERATPASPSERPPRTPLDEGLLRQRLVDHGPYARLERVESIGSTNAFLVQELVRSGAADSGGGQPDAGWPHLSVLTAEEQTGGSGRLGRSWASPKHASLSTSVVLRPQLPAEDLAWLSLLAGVALTEVLRQEHGIPASLKWPNDVHVHGRKISGILSVLAGGGPAAGGALVLGCGINVLLEQEELPTPTSTSVLLELARTRPGRSLQGAGEGPDLRAGLLASFLERLAEILAAAEEAGSVAPLRPRITAVMDTVGQQVRVELPDGTARSGTAVGLDQDGSLIVEVTHRRPAADQPDQPGQPDRSSAADQGWHEAAEGRRSFSAGDVVHLRRR